MIHKIKRDQLNNVVLQVTLTDCQNISVWCGGNLPELSTQWRIFTLFCVRNRSQQSSFTYQSLLLQSEEFVTLFFSSTILYRKSMAPEIHLVESSALEISVEKLLSYAVVRSIEGAVSVSRFFSFLSDFWINKNELLKHYELAPSCTQSIIQIFWMPLGKCQKGQLTVFDCSDFMQGWISSQYQVVFFRSGTITPNEYVHLYSRVFRFQHKSDISVQNWHRGF